MINLLWVLSDTPRGVHWRPPLFGGSMDMGTFTVMVRGRARTALGASWIST